MSYCYLVFVGIHHRLNIKMDDMTATQNVKPKRLYRPLVSNVFAHFVQKGERHVVHLFIHSVVYVARSEMGGGGRVKGCLRC